jgi:hypothetical protein
MANPEFSVVFSLDVHSDREGEPFSETHTGLDYVGFAVEDHSSLEEWERHLTELNADHSPLTCQPLDDQSGYSAVVFRDSDNVQLEFRSMA